MSASKIIEVLSRQENPVSSRKIAVELGIEQTSENLNAIKHECFQLVESGVAIAYQMPEACFFSLS